MEKTGIPSGKITQVQVLQDAMFRRMKYLLRVARAMNSDRSGPMAEAAIRVYAWKIETSVQEVVQLLDKLKLVLSADEQM